MKQKILVIEPQKVVLNSISKIFPDYDVIAANSAAGGLRLANDNDFVAVITELSLAGHSGFEFLYEFRSYNDWQDTPIIVHSTVKLTADVLRSRAWRALRIQDYLYKPASSLSALKDSVEKAVNTQISV